MPPDFIARQASLTPADLEAIAEIVVKHNHCNLGLTPEDAIIIRQGLTADEISLVKKVSKAFDAAASLIGKTILIAIVGTLVAILTRGFWATLISGVMRNGGH